jgi:hypothetical protein
MIEIEWFIFGLEGESRKKEHDDDDDDEERKKKHNSKEMEGKLLRRRMAWLIVGYAKLWAHSFLCCFFCRHHRTACRQAIYRAETTKLAVRIMQPSFCRFTYEFSCIYFIIDY